MEYKKNLFLHFRNRPNRNKIVMRYGDMTDFSGLSNAIIHHIRKPEFSQFEIYNLAPKAM